MTLLVFFIFFGACAAAATTGALFPPDAWYRNLQKPDWTPPNWLFPTAWTVLYLMMSYAGARLAQIDGAGLALALWSLQIALNTLWTPIFFGLHKIRAAMAVIGALWLSVAGATFTFFVFDALSGWLFLPYLVWVSFAAALNWSILMANPDQGAATA